MKQKFSAQGSVNSNNSISQELNRRRRAPRPPIAVILKWQQEWRDSGAQYRQSFYMYKKKRMRPWHQARKKKPK